jgi:UDP-N-acetyl-D-glucosamine/UDP-N-acetyl-D-galactosamine dehydrogenase
MVQTKTISTRNDTVNKDKILHKTVCVVGLGYVGLPLAFAFSHHFNVIGFDVNKQKISSIKNHEVPGFEYDYEKNNLVLSSNEKEIATADVVIIAVPTPVTKSKQPDMSFICSAGELVGRNMKSGAIVVLESTVYPGATEEVLVPVLEKHSNLVCGVDFFVGYSPERVNPGDSDHTIDKITKIVSGMNTQVTDELADIYGKITSVYKAGDIKTAEAAKVIENIQRDLNIALVNELCIIFHKLGIDTKEVLDAAQTKWNFHRYNPGLVGGHCIPVDPYYLVYKANELEYHPQVILAGRSVNDAMPGYVVDMTMRSFNKAGKVLNGSSVLVMGLTFKENVDDTRETPVRGIIKELKEFHCKVYGYDPLLGKDEVESFGIECVTCLDDVRVDCVIICVAHDVFKNFSFQDVSDLLKKECGCGVVIDVKGLFKNKVSGEDVIYRSL